MALITINIRGKDVVINPDTITVLKTVPISRDKWGIQLNWLPKNSAILTVNQDNVFNSKGEADTALQLIRQEIEENSSSKVDTTIYRAAGSLTALEIVNDLLVEENLGNVYNITETFTTTIDFVEGVGIEFAAGTNIVIIDSGNEVYKFDVLTGFIDTSSFLTSVPQANENNIGGIKATTRNNTNDTQEVKIDTLSGKLYVEKYPTIPTVPTNVSAFTNDAGYLTSHQSLANYYTKTEIDSMIGDIETALDTILGV